MIKNNITKKGKVLISAPFMGDIFKRSVILLTEHNDEGSIGFILNKPVNLRINDILEDFPDFSAKVYYGGPVQQDMLNFICRQNYFDDESSEITEGLYWNGNYEKLKDLIISRDIDPEDIKFFLGYSGWSHGQLENEIKSNSWYLSKPTVENIFDKSTTELWSKTLRSMGNEYKVISSFPDDPSVN